MAVDNLQPGISTDDLVAEEGSGEPIVLDVGSAANLTVPGGTMMLTADFVREGPDLVIEGQDGTEIIVRDYYTGKCRMKGEEDELRSNFYVET